MNIQIWKGTSIINDTNILLGHWLNKQYQNRLCLRVSMLVVCSLLFIYLLLKIHYTAIHMKPGSSVSNLKDAIF